LGWVVPLSRIVAADGLSGRSIAEVARPVQARLSIRSLLRRFSDEGLDVVVMAAGCGFRGRIARVGRDFLELDALTGSGTASQQEPARLVSLERLTMVQVGR